MKRAWLVIDGQWGSTGKGLLAGYLAIKWKPDTAVCNFGPNAGHTVVTDNGDVVMTQMLPSAIISPYVRTILIGPGAIIDPKILASEVERFDHYLDGKLTVIHPMATIVSQDHKDRECAQLNRISSTCKGTGAAQCDKVMRMPGSVARDNQEILPIKVVSHEVYTRLLHSSQSLQIESAQGMELGINTGKWFPYCTSRDINVYQVMSDCGIPYRMFNPYVVASMRTFPIRVGNAFDDLGNMIGTSGPVYPDQTEVTWEQLGVKSEKTTVTKKVRRVFTWSWTNFDKVINVLNPSSIFLNFVNYLEENPTFESPATEKFIESIETRFRMVNPGNDHRIVRWVGTGPKVTDVMERGQL